MPAESPPPRPRLPVEMLFHFEKYREYTVEELEEAFRTMASITKSGDWLKILDRYAGRGGYFENEVLRWRNSLKNWGLGNTFIEGNLLDVCYLYAA